MGGKKYSLFWKNISALSTAYHVECCARLVLTGFVAVGLQPATRPNCLENLILNCELDHLKGVRLCVR